MSIDRPILPADFLDRLFDVPTYRWVLPNGLTVVHRPAFGAELVSAQVWVKTGSIHEGVYTGCGLSHYLEHMLFKGTKRRTGRAISREVEGFGGSSNAYTPFDRTVYYIDGPARAAGPILDVLEDMVFHSLIDDAEATRERDVILREIDMYLDDPSSQLSTVLFANAFQKHPYREPVIGHRALFEGVTPAELREYYRGRYLPNNTVLVVAGAIERAELEALVEAKFGALQMGRVTPTAIPAEPPQLASRRRDLSGDFQIGRGCVAFGVPGLSHPDSPALDTLALILGQGDSSLLWQRIRNEQGLVHEVDAFNWNPGTNGLFFVSFVCDPGKMDEAEVAIRREINQILAGALPVSAVEKAVRQAVARELKQRKTVQGQAARLGAAEVVVGDLSYPERYLRRLGELDAARVLEAGRTYLQDDSSTTVLLRPEATNGPSVEPSAAAKDGRAAPREHHLSNGVRVFLEAAPSLPRVAVTAALQAGPYFEADAVRGASRLLASLLTEDTARLSSGEIAETIDGLGASFSAESGNNAIVAKLEVFPFDLQTGLDIFADGLLRPSLEGKCFATEKAAQIADIEAEDDELLDYAFNEFQKRFFAGTPLALPAIGTRTSVKRLDVDTIKALHAALLYPENLVLSVVGDYDPATILADLESRFGGLTAKGAKPTAAQTPGLALVAGRETRERKREQAVVIAGYPGPGLGDFEESLRAAVLNGLFTGMASRLFERVRDEQGLAYYISATRLMSLETGAYVFYAGTHPSQTGAVLNEITAEVERVCAGAFEEGEIEGCVTRLRAQRESARQSINRRGERAALNALYGLPVDDEAQVEAFLSQVQGEEIAAFARRWLKAGQRLELIAGPAGASPTPEAVTADA